MRKKLIIVYARVSSGSQSLREQKDAAKKFLKVRNIDEKDVLFLEDFNVSATKNDIANRPKFKRMLQLISEDKVDTIIIYARDRAYRNFYEGSQFNDIVNRHGVEVIYTASGSIPFNKNSSIESFYGIFAQQEGQNINKRSSDAVKRYPGETIGYKRIENKSIGDRKKVTFIKDDNRSVLIESLFEEFSLIQTKEEFVAVLTKYGKGLNGHATVMRILRRPFYSAHCHTDYGYDPLEHVEPIISLELFKKVQVTMENFVTQYEEEVMRCKEKIIFNPVCSICSKEMKFKKSLNKPSYFVCSNRHKRIAIELDELNQFIEETLMKEIKKFTLSAYDPIFQLHLKSVRNKLFHQQQHKKQLLEKNTLSFASDALFKFSTKHEHLKTEIQIIKDEIETIDRELELLKALKHEIKTISNIVPLVSSNLIKTDLEILIELLIKDIQVHHDYLELNMYSFTTEEKGVG